MILLELFLAFLKVGTFSFGGGYGAVALIRDVVTSHGWMDAETLACMIAVSESTPGPIMVNMATYVGTTQAGFWGAAVATSAVVIPSLCIILAISILLNGIIRNKKVQAILGGMKPCVTGIILATGASMLLTSCFPGGSFDWKAMALAAALGTLLYIVKGKLKKKIPPAVLILIAALGAMVLY